MSVATRAQAAVGAGAEGARRVAPSPISDEADEVAVELQRAGQVGTIIAGVVIGATLLIGFFVVSSISDAIPIGQIYADPANESLAQDRNSTLDRVGDGFLIGGVVIIVLFSAVILRVLRGLQ